MNNGARERFKGPGESFDRIPSPEVIVKLSFSIFHESEMLYIAVRDDKSWSKLKFISAFSRESL